MARASSLWPASATRAASVSPDLSSASVRVSDTVSTAIPTGMKERVSSFFDIMASNRLGILQIPLRLHRLKRGTRRLASHGVRIDTKACGARAGHAGKNGVRGLKQSQRLDDLALYNLCRR